MPLSALAIDQTSRQGEARIALPYDRALRPGGFASVTIGTGGVNAPMLPESAIMNDNKGSFVYVVDKNNRVQRRDVREATACGDRVGLSVLGVDPLRGLLVEEGVPGGQAPLVGDPHRVPRRVDAEEPDSVGDPSLEERPVVGADVDGEARPTQPEHLHESGRQALKVQRGRPGRAAEEREPLVHDVGVHDVAELREAALVTVVHLHRIVGFRLRELRPVQDEVTDGLEAEVEPGTCDRPADLARDRDRLVAPLAPAGQTASKSPSTRGHGQRDPAKNP